VTHSSAGPHDAIHANVNCAVNRAPLPYHGCGNLDARGARKRTSTRSSRSLPRPAAGAAESGLIISQLVAQRLLRRGEIEWEDTVRAGQAPVVESNNDLNSDLKLGSVRVTRAEVARLKPARPKHPGAVESIAQVPTNPAAGLLDRRCGPRCWQRPVAGHTAPALGLP
jgi:hypothetical protein